jgi:hypothetical protein
MFRPSPLPLCEYFAPALSSVPRHFEYTASAPTLLEGYTLLTRATRFRHFLGFLGLHGNSQRFLWRISKPTVIEGDGSHFPLERASQKA